MSKQFKILVVDDEPIDLQIITSALKDEYDVLSAQSGKEAIELAKKHLPDLIILDVMMPGMSGYDVCKILKNEVPLAEIPIVFVTAFNTKEGELRGLKVGGVDYITKPINFELLKIRIKNQLVMKEQLDLITRQKMELNAFNSTVSHDLKQPLHIINLYCQALLSKDMILSSVEMAEYTQEIYDSTLKMADLISALLNFSAASQGQVRQLETDLSQIVKMFATEHRILNPNRRVNFEITENILATGDPALLSLVLQNLIGNAWKFSADNKNTLIEFGLREGTKRVYFVRDNGPGFDLDEAHKLFIPFERLGEKKTEGHGIGLATVKRIILRHGGEIWAESDVGQGATFFFTLE